MNVKHIFWAVVTTFQQARVEACIPRPKIGDPKTRRYASASDDHDVLRLLQEVDRIINIVESLEFLPSIELSLYALTQDEVIEVLWEAHLRGDTKCGNELLYSVAAVCQILFDELFCSY